jgi:plasminogen activator
MTLHTLKKSVALLSMAAVFPLCSAHAQTQPTAVSGTDTQGQVQKTSSITIGKSASVVSGRLSLGLLNGDADEIVYNPGNGAKVSQLEWELDNVAMLGAGISISPKSWLKLNGDIWINISEGNGAMNDYDWLLPTSEWSDWSYHEDTEVDRVIMLDLSADLTFHAAQHAQFFGILGFKRDSFEWTARGGDFVYSVNGFRDTTGSIPGELQVVSYEQTFLFPYIGLGFEVDFAPVTFKGRIIGSTLVDVEAEDTHYLRGLMFDDSFETGSMIAVDLGVSYHLSKRLHVTGGLHYQNYDEVQGSTIITDQSTGFSYLVEGDAAGADNSSTMILATISYDF